MLASLAGRGNKAGLHRVAARRVAERVKNHVGEYVPTTASCGHVERAIGRFSFGRVSPRSPRSPRPVAALAAIRGIAKPPVWPVSARAGLRLAAGVSAFAAASS